MARKPTPQPLALSSPQTNNEEGYNVNAGPKSPQSLRSPRSPRSPFRFSTKLGQGFGDPPSTQPAEQENRRDFSTSPTTSSLSSLQQTLGAGRQSSRDRGREQDRPATSPARGGFFSNYKASKSSSRLQQAETAAQAEDNMSRDNDRSTATGKVSSSDKNRSDRSVDKTLARRPVGGNSSKPDPPTTESTDSLTASAPPSAHLNKKGKPKPFSILNRTKSIRNDGESPGEVPITITEPEGAQVQGIRTAPLRPDTDRSFRDIMASSSRNRSADRQLSSSRDLPGNAQKDHGRGHISSSYRENGAGGFFGNLKSGGSKAVGLGKGFFNKVGRSGSTSEKEPVIDDEHYVLKVINLSLVEQTRKTRISKKLEDSRDKTEFWMPAFPWRAIDYLNYRGTETEGLYRVPGSGPQIKKWQRRFDEELDIDLFEQEDLYDINIIGSMLKAWLRELPEEIFPKASQDRIARECAGAEVVPQLLIDELSNLSPFNYYLLFAITCHLSLLLAHADKNKMDFRNLCICFQPCMKIDAFCFKFLVVDWRDCWKGCKNEQLWTEEEYRLFDQIPPSSGEGRSSMAVESHDERNVSSSDSSKPSSVSLDHSTTPKNYLTPKPITTSASYSSLSTDTTMSPERNVVKATGELKPLAPIAPLSPMRL